MTTPVGVPPSFRRTIGLYPTRRGFAYAVLEARGLLVTWGAARDNGRDAVFLGRLETLMNRYAPRRVAIEDGSNASRGERAKRRRTQVIEVAASRACDVQHTSRTMVRRVLGLPDAATNHDVATRLAAVFEELLQHLPPKRRLWEAEDPRMPVFYAVGLALGGSLAADVGRVKGRQCDSSLQEHPREN